MYLEFYKILLIARNQQMQTTDINWKDKTLLIAEDDIANYKIVKQFLRKTNVKIIWAETGNEVLFFLNSTELSIDAVIMDLEMPEIDGIETTRQLKSTHPNLPVILYSAFSNKPEYSNKKEIFDEQLTKPVKRTKLIETLNKYFNAQ